MTRLLLVLLLVGCSSPAQQASDSLHAKLDDSPNCTTELQTSSDLCDPDHLLVLTCVEPEACPDYRRCVSAPGMPYGQIWCCTP
jgi:hypothetical protein